MIDSITKSRLKQKYGDEKVLVFPFNDKNFMKIPDRFSPKIFSCDDTSSSRFVFRYDAEYNDSLIQPIPYIIVINDNRDKAYVLKRTAGEERLKDSFALGCGGHISPCDMCGFHGSVFEAAAEREMHEELAIKGNSILVPCGTVQEKASPTHEHLGIVYATFVTEKNVKVKETDKMVGTWMTFDEIVSNYDKFESWGRRIIDWIFENGHSLECMIQTKNKRYNEEYPA